MAARRYFHAARLDRAADRREDEQWLAGQLRAARARFLPVCDGRLGLRPGDPPELAWLSTRNLEVEPEYTAFLGLSGDIPCFALSLEASAASNVCRTHAIEMRGLRTVASLVDAESAGVGAYARALDLWQRSHRFCGTCGASTRVDQGGFCRTCSGCGRPHFPRVDPAIIVAVLHDGRCLLGRQPNWPERLYSVLAGFVEPGETFEATLAREVYEESGIEVVETSYQGSQPWPFPSSLMVGFRATARDDRVRVGNELEAAFFIGAEELGRRVGRGEMILPAGLSISRYLIDAWVYETSGEDTRDWQPETAWRSG